MQNARRFLEASKCVASYDTVKRYLESYVGKKPVAKSKNAKRDL